jgi:hypothetical protein
MISKLRELNDTELEVVAGGMDCRSALAASSERVAVGSFLLACGATVEAAASFGEAKGLVNGACGPAPK